MNVCCRKYFGFNTPENADGQISRITISKPVPYLNNVHIFSANFKRDYNYFYLNTR